MTREMRMPAVLGASPPTHPATCASRSGLICRPVASVTKALKSSPSICISIMMAMKVCSTPFDAIHSMRAECFMLNRLMPDATSCCCRAWSSSKLKLLLADLTPAAAG